MDHRLVQHIEKALGWAGPQPIGAEFGFGRMPDPSLCDGYSPRTSCSASSCAAASPTRSCAACNTAKTCTPPPT
jgi:hypothetical protein